MNNTGNYTSNNSFNNSDIVKVSIAAAVVLIFIVAIALSYIVKIEYKDGFRVSFEKSSQSTPSALPSPTPTSKEAIKPSNEILPPAIWRANKSDKRYLFYESAQSVQMVEVNDNGEDVVVGKGTRIGTKLRIDFFSTIHGVRGILILELSPDGKTMEGDFEGIDPAHQQHVILTLTK